MSSTETADDESKNPGRVGWERCRKMRQAVHDGRPIAAIADEMGYHRETVAKHVAGDCPHHDVTDDEFVADIRACCADVGYVLSRKGYLDVTALRGKNVHRRLREMGGWQEACAAAGLPAPIRNTSTAMKKRIYELAVEKRVDPTVGDVTPVALADGWREVGDE